MTALQEEAVDTYNIRAQVSQNTKQIMQQEQARRLLATGERVSMVELAAEWLNAHAAQVKAGRE